MHFLGFRPFDECSYRTEITCERLLLDLASAGAGLCGLATLPVRPCPPSIPLRGQAAKSVRRPSGFPALPCPATRSGTKHVFLAHATSRLCRRLRLRHRVRCTTDGISKRSLESPHQTCATPASGYAWPRSSLACPGRRPSVAMTRNRQAGPVDVGTCCWTKETRSPEVHGGRHVLVTDRRRNQRGLVVNLASGRLSIEMERAVDLTCPRSATVRTWRRWLNVRSRRTRQSCHPPQASHFSLWLTRIILVTPQLPPAREAAHGATSVLT